MGSDESRVPSSFSSRKRSGRSAQTSPASKEPLPLVSVKDSSPMRLARRVHRHARLSLLACHIGRGLELVQLTEHAPVAAVVVHCEAMDPPSVRKVTAVTCGTGLL